MIYCGSFLQSSLILWTRSLPCRPGRLRQSHRTPVGQSIQLRLARPYQATLGNVSAALADLKRSEELPSEKGKPAYIAASGYIRLNRFDDAIRLLRLAFQRSPELLDDIATDDDFDPIRETPDFRALLIEFGSDPPTNQLSVLRP